MAKLVIVTGSSCDFGPAAACTLAHAGHCAYASMCDRRVHDAAHVDDPKAVAREHELALRPSELDVTSEASVDAASGRIVADSGRLDVVVLAPPDTDPEEVARAVVRVVDTPPGKPPLRVHLDATDDGTEAVNDVADRVRAEFLRRIGLGDRDHSDQSHGRRD